MIIKKAYPVFVSMFFAFTVVCTGCLPKAKQLRQVSLNMSKDEVVGVLGEPAVARGCVRNKFNQTVEVWEYVLALPSDDSGGEIAGKAMITVLTLGMTTPLFIGEKRDYWLYFLDDKLVQWGEAGDWEREAKRIYEINFHSSPGPYK